MSVTLAVAAIALTVAASAKAIIKVVDYRSHAINRMGRPKSYL